MATFPQTPVLRRRDYTGRKQQHAIFPMEMLLVNLWRLIRDDSPLYPNVPVDDHRVFTEPTDPQALKVLDEAASMTRQPHWNRLYAPDSGKTISHAAHHYLVQLATQSRLE